MKQYWLVLYNDTFLWVKGESGCIYNAHNNSIFNFKNTGELKLITDKLLDLDSLYRVSLRATDLTIREIKDFVHSIQKTYSGELVWNNGSHERPVSLKPELRIQDGKEYYKWAHIKNIDGSVIHNLHKLIFYCNSSQYGSMEYYKQVCFPLAQGKEISCNQIENWVNDLKSSYWFSEICLVGDIWNYSEYLSLFRYFENMRKLVNVYGIDRDVLAHIEKIKNWEDTIRCFKIWVTSREYCTELFGGLKDCKFVSYYFAVSSVSEFEQAENIIVEYNLQNVEILPIYKIDNMSFFEEQIFLEKEDIGEFKLTRRDIFIRQTLNIYNFGKFFVMPNGDVYANPNDEKIGSINEPLHDLVYREIVEGKSWLRIRDQKPCCDCVYQWLCPSPSNYELLIGRSNLCHISDSGTKNF